jgi:hypothetical protein
MSSNPFGADRWEEVQSSNISAIGAKGSWLIIKFKKGGESYRYEDFADMFDDLVSAQSVGKLFNREVLSVTKGQRLSLEEWPDE